VAAPFVAGAVVAAGLPIPHTALIGRDIESARLIALLGQPASRLVTLTGPGGCGKTRLAVEVASMLADRFDDGIAFVALDEVHDPARVPARIGHVLGVPEVDDDGQGGEDLVEFLRDRRMLIVLDNFEHVVAAAPVIGIVASRCPRVMWLATSRRPLHLRDEQLVEVRPLAVPDPDRNDPEVTAAAPAVAMFCERAAAVNSGFTPTPRALTSVAGICRLVDGLPLAIELAAAYVRMLPPAALLDELARPARSLHRTLLGRGTADAAAHHRGLGETIRWSYDLLAPRAQQLLRRLAVFDGGWSLEAMDAVCAGAAEDPLLDALADLVDLHLVEPADEGNGAPRYRLLETVRDFALDRLDDAGERAEVESRHADAYARFAVEAGAGLESRREPVWVRRVEAELPNLWTMFERLAAAGRVADGLRAAAALGPLWLDRGPARSGRQQLDRFLAMAADARTEAPAELVAAAIGWSARLGLEHGDIMTTKATGEDPVARLQRAAAVADAAGDQLGWLRVVEHLTYAHRLRGEAEELDRCLASGLERCRTPETRWLRAELLHCATIVAHERGERDRAIELAHQCIEVAKMAGNERIRLRATLTVILLAGGSAQTARHQLEETFQRFLDIGDRRGAAMAAAGLGATVTKGGGPDSLRTAAEWYGRTIRLGRAVGNWHAVGWGVMGMVAVAARDGRTAAAARLHGALSDYFEVLRRETPRAMFSSYDADVAELRVRLGDAEFTAHSEIGATLNRHAVADEALAVAAEIAAGGEETPKLALRRRGPRANPELTDRERQVLAELVHGHTNQGIADALGVSPKTVMHHTVSVYRKLAVRGRAEAIAHALRAGLVTT
jgi:predicted ATPase/DNA-binding CsgD family transcriptional regulator